jgi:hypothetical protein
MYIHPQSLTGYQLAFLLFRDIAILGAHSALIYHFGLE